MYLPRRTRYLKARLAIGILIACLALAACADSDSDDDPANVIDPTPTTDAIPTYTGPGELRTIQAGTQLHLDGVDIGTGNIWEEEYTPVSGQVTRGLTALLAVTVEQDPAQNQNLRVHPGQEVEVPGYRLQVVAIDAERIHLAVIEDAP